DRATLRSHAVRLSNGGGAALGAAGNHGGPQQPRGRPVFLDLTLLQKTPEGHPGRPQRAGPPGRVSGAGGLVYAIRAPSDQIRRPRTHAPVPGVTEALRWLQVARRLPAKLLRYVWITFSRACSESWAVRVPRAGLRLATTMARRNQRHARPCSAC